MNKIDKDIALMTYEAAGDLLEVAPMDSENWDEKNPADPFDFSHKQYRKKAEELILETEIKWDVGYSFLVVSPLNDGNTDGKDAYIGAKVAGYRVAEFEFEDGTTYYASVKPVKKDGTREYVKATKVIWMKI